jgi:hypothetical protein
VARNFYKNGQEEVISTTLPNRLLELPPLTARISGVFADAEALAMKVGTTKKLHRMQ